jgi:single-strand DNA-binding protein
MNNVVLIGRLTKDPELRYIPESQNAVATFTIAVDRPMAKEKTADFIRITVFGKQAENCERFLTKGRLVGIQGRLQTGSYKNKEGATVYTTDVVADRVEFLEWGDKAGSGDQSNFGFERQDAKGAPGIPEGFQALEDDDSIHF